MELTILDNPTAADATKSIGAEDDLSLSSWDRILGRGQGGSRLLSRSRVNFILRKSQAVNWTALSILKFDGFDSLLEDRHHDGLYANDFKADNFLALTEIST